jgi:hypothetical protein
VHDASGDVTDSAIELRRSIGVVLLSEGRTAEAEDVLRALHADLCLVNGPDHEDAEDIAGVLARIRLSDS